MADDKIQDMVIKQLGQVQAEIGKIHEKINKNHLETIGKIHEIDKGVLGNKFRIGIFMSVISIGWGIVLKFIYSKFL